MCGLVGLIATASNGFFVNEQECFSNLLYIDQLRGQDSTGITAFYNDGEVDVFKNAIEASTMMLYDEYGAKEFKEIQNKLFSKGRAALGHNRKATIGKITTETAHPFIIAGKYFFMHNGTLRNHRLLCDGAGDAFDVDSEALGHHICPVAFDTTALEKALSEVGGAYACQWVDQEKEMLYLLRNKERPLWLAKCSTGYMWASEPSFIYACAQRNRIKIEECSEIPEDTLFSIDLTKPTTFEGVALTVKKSIPPVKTITGGCTTIVNKTISNNKEGNSGKVSKSFFKRLQKRVVGQTVTFWVDDYVERHYPEDLNEWLVWGTAVHTFEFPHRVSTVVKTTKHVVENMFNGSLVQGMVTHMDFNPSDRDIIFHVDNVQVVPKSCH